jgi:hypothetical protein
MLYVMDSFWVNFKYVLFQCIWGTSIYYVKFFFEISDSSPPHKNRTNPYTFKRVCNKAILTYFQGKNKKSIFVGRQNPNPISKVNKVIQVCIHKILNFMTCSDLASIKAIFSNINEYSIGLINFVCQSVATVLLQKQLT